MKVEPLPVPGEAFFDAARTLWSSWRDVKVAEHGATQASTVISASLVDPALSVTQAFPWDWNL
jgi:hypothetical protein